MIERMWDYRLGTYLLTIDSPTYSSILAKQYLGSMKYMDMDYRGWIIEFKGLIWVRNITL